MSNNNTLLRYSVLPIRLSPLSAKQEVAKDVDSEDVEVVSEENVEQE